MTNDVLQRTLAEATVESDGSPATFAYGVLSYLIGVGGLAAFILAIGGLIPAGLGPVFTAGGWDAALVNIGLLTLFGLQHSVMARPGFKRRWTRLVPHEAERSTFVLLAGLAMGLVVALWQPMPGVVRDVTDPVSRGILWTVFAAGWVYLLAATFAINHFDLFGLRQTWLAARGQAYTPVKFVERAMYRYSRHPIMAGILVGSWAAPTMTRGTTLMAAVITAYIAVGVAFEERDLVRQFGSRYLEYRRRVGALFTLPEPGRRDTGPRRRGV